MRTIATAATLLILVMAVATSLLPPVGMAQQGPSLGVDADPAGNTATTLGAIDQCVSVQRGDTFSVDVFVADVTDLLAWETYFSFDGSIVNVTERDVKLFQAANANSDVFDASESLPSTGGLYRLGAIDFGQPPSPDSGSGVLARLTLKAVGAGISPAILITLDANNDTRPDLGPRLKDPRETPIGDSNGDEIFDGTIVNAQIAVDRDCPPGTTATAVPTPTTSPAGGSPTTSPIPTGTGTPPGTTPASSPPRETATVTQAVASATPAPPSPDDDGGSDWKSPAFVTVYAAVGTVVVLAVAGLALMSARRRRL